MATYGKGRTSGTRGWERGDESQREIREGRDIREGTVGAARRVGRRAKLLPLVRYVSRYGRYYGERWVVRQEAGRPIRFGTYNIQNGRNGGLESALGEMLQKNVDLGVFQEMTVTKRIYTQESSGYRVVSL